MLAYSFQITSDTRQVGRYLEGQAHRFIFFLRPTLDVSYHIVSYFVQGGSLPGFPFLASIIVIFSGAQLFALGIIGEYLARMHFRTMDRPPYAVRELAERPQEKSPHVG